MTDVKMLLDHQKEASQTGRPAKLRLRRWRTRRFAPALLVIVCVALIFGLWSARARFGRIFTSDADAKRPLHVIPLTTFAGSEM